MAESLDVRENQMQVVTEATYLRCLDSAGNSVLVRPKDLGNEVFTDKGTYSGGDYDANELIQNGIYKIGQGIKNTPPNCLWTDLIVFRGYSIFQVITSKTNMKIFRRIGSIGSSNTVDLWGEWKEF